MSKIIEFQIRCSASAGYISGNRADDDQNTVSITFNIHANLKNLAQAIQNELNQPTKKYWLQDATEVSIISPQEYQQYLGTVANLSTPIKK